MNLTKEILTQLRDAAETQRQQALAAANAADGQVHLLNHQLKLLEQPEPEAPKKSKA